MCLSVYLSVCLWQASCVVYRKVRMEGFRLKNEKEFICLVLVHMRSCSWHLTLTGNSLGSLSNHDDDGNKNPTNLHTWNDLFCSCVNDVSIWWQMFHLVFLCPKRWFQFNSRILRTHFSSVMTFNNWKMIAETRSYIFRWRSRFGRRRVCLSSLLSAARQQPNFEERSSSRRRRGLQRWVMYFRLVKSH